MTDSKMFLKEYAFYGKHCDMVMALSKETIDSSSGATLFPLTIDLFIMSSIVGVYFNKKSKPDIDKSRNTKIFAEQFNSHSKEIKLAFKFVTLLGNETKFTPVERLNKTFRNPEVDENYQQFEEYMLGGLEEIYDHIMVKSNVSYQQYLTSVNQFVSNFNMSKENDDTEKTNISTDDLV